MMRTPSFFKRHCYLLLALAGCGTIAGNPGTTTKPSAVPEDILLPDASSINLSQLGSTSATNLLSSGACSADTELGVFGFAFGPICSGGPLIDAFLYGAQKDSDEDGTITCADFDPESEDSGILFTLLCSEAFIVLENLKSLASDEFAIDFSDFNATDDVSAVGSWTATATEGQNYPADVRIWSQDPNGQLAGSLAMQINSQTSGSLFLDLFPFGENFATHADYGSPEGDGSTCSGQPNKSNCYWQDMRFKGPEDYKEDAIAPGMRVLVFADSKDEPSFYRIEAKIRYSESFANIVFDPSKVDTPDNFEQVREIYLRAVQKGDEIWGSFDFKNAEGQTISSSSNGFDTGMILRNGFSDIDYAGICQNLGSEDLKECETILYTDYDQFWIGDELFEGVGVEYELPVSFGQIPSEGVIFGP